jgi:co-chaperonin GroES (HSP10)
MKIKKIIDDKILLNWYDFNSEKNAGGIIIHERYTRAVNSNIGTVEQIGNKVIDINVGNKILYAVGSVYQPIEINGEMKIIIPRDDVILIIE